MKYDDDRLIDNAACASQLHALMDEETTRQAVKDNVCAPLRAQIAALTIQRDKLLKAALMARDLMHSAVDIRDLLESAITPVERQGGE